MCVCVCVCACVPLSNLLVYYTHVYVCTDTCMCIVPVPTILRVQPASFPGLIFSHIYYDPQKNKQKEDLNVHMRNHGTTYAISILRDLHIFV